MSRSMKKLDRSDKTSKKQMHAKRPRKKPGISMARNEEWRLTEDERVLVSNHGRIKRNGYMVKPTERADGYLATSVNGVVQPIHRLVAKAFIENPDNLPIIDHIDGDIKNNHAENLRWVTIAQNSKYAYEQGLNHGSNKSVLILAFNTETGMSRLFRSLADTERQLDIPGNRIRSVVDTPMRYKKYLFFRIKEIDVIKTLGNEYHGVTAEGGVWSERNEGGVALRLVDNRDNPMTQGDCIKTVNKLYEQIVGDE